MSTLSRIKKKIIPSFITLCVSLCISTLTVSRAHTMDECVFISGSCNPELAHKVAQKLSIRLTDPGLQHFSNGEIAAEIQGEVRGKNVYIFGSFVQRDGKSVNDQLVEYQLIADAAKRSGGAKTINAILLNHPYARQDRRSKTHASISASFVAATLENVIGISRVFTFDLHANQIQGFFQKTGVDNISTSHLFAQYLVKNTSIFNDPIVVISPDAGGTERAGSFQSALAQFNIDSDFATMIKKRVRPGKVESTTLVGDVSQKAAIIIDDICDTGGTLVASAEALKDAGATKVYACITHAIFSKDALDKILQSCFDGVFITDTLPIERLPQDKVKLLEGRLHVISIADMLSDILRTVIDPHAFERPATPDFRM